MNNCSCTQKEKSVFNNQDSSAKLVVVDLLFLDLSVCTRCQGTESSLDDSLEAVLELLNNIGYKVQLNKIHIETEVQAIEYQFISSPIIRVNGQDIQMEVQETHCSTCSSLTDGASVDCRIWLYNGEEYSVPPKQMIIDAILNKIYNTQKVNKLSAKNKYALPANLIEYFAKKDKLCAAVHSDS